MAIRLIAVDIDGTLLDSRHELPEANTRAITDAVARGVEVALTTGRRFDFAMPIARQIPCNLTMVVNNGALIKFKDGSTHLRKLLAVPLAREVLSITQPWRAGAAVVFDRARENQVIWEHINWDDPGRRGYFERNREFIAQMPLLDCLTEDPIQVMFTGPVQEMRDAGRALQGSPLAAQFAVAYTEYVERDFALLDVLHRESTKGRALAEWARIRGFSRDQVMAIGDNHNDREMLEFAGLPVVVANAVPALRENGWLLTASNDEAGVAAAISRHVLGGAS